MHWGVAVASLRVGHSKNEPGCVVSSMSTHVSMPARRFERGFRFCVALGVSMWSGLGLLATAAERQSEASPLLVQSWAAGSDNRRESICQKKRSELHLLRIVIQNNMCYRSGIMSSNEKTISFRAVAEKIEALDSLATAQERSRSYLINEAITNYIELQAYQDALVRKGLEEMRKGRVVSHEQVLKRLKRTGRVR
jgi:RHH-type rel operon transcriptional repressor/antitoxin RelB